LGTASPHHARFGQRSFFVSSHNRGEISERILRQRLGNATFEKWYRSGNAYLVTDTVPAQIMASTEFKLNWIITNHAQHLNVAFPEGWEAMLMPSRPDK
jgi:hypothetical protein